jgi:outer membrane protein insertion porin family
MFISSPVRLLKYSLLLILILSSVNTIAQEKVTSYKILGISIEGNKSADASTIIASTGLKVGDEIQVPGDKTINAIKNLWTLNIFSDVQIFIDKQLADGVFLLIKVQEHPRVEKVIIEGNDEIDTDDIEKTITFIRGTILKPQEVSKLLQRINKLYEDEGFFNTKFETRYYNYFTADTTKDQILVKWRNTKDLSDEMEIEYDLKDNLSSNLISKIKERLILKIIIEEGDEVTVRKIEFEGNRDFDDGDLKGAMDETSEKTWWKFWDGAKFNPNDYAKDKELIIKFYQRNGYRDAEILSDTLIYSEDKRDLNILINVYEGNQYKIRNIIWEGNTVYPSYVLSSRLEFAPGDIYDMEKFEQNLRGNEKQSDVSALYLDEGYLTFNLQTKETKVADDSLDITIRVEERNQFKVGRVDIFGNDKTKEKVIRRELYTVPGDFFNRGLLFRSVQNLANLQYFNVEKLYGPDGITTKLASDSTVDIGFKVEEKSSDYLNASVGYSGSFGFSGAIGVTLTNFSIAEPFSLGGGQVLSFNWQFGVGNLYRTFSIGFTEPWMFDTPTSVGFDLFDTRQKYIYDLRQSGVTFRVGRRLKWPDDFFYVQGRVRYQYNNIIEGQNYYPEGQYNQFTVGGIISRKNIDNPIFPSQGSSFMLDAEVSGGKFLPGEVDYLKISFVSEWYRRLLNSNRFALYLISDLGFIQELEENTIINPFEKFWMGGNGLVIATTPLRGYEDRSVGPRNVFGDLIGGYVKVKFGAELRVAVSMEPIPLYILAFAEAGNVFESFDKTDIFGLRRSVGFGARIMINPIGLIGFDLGYGFDRKEVTGRPPEWLFHFQFGKGF